MQANKNFSIAIQICVYMTFKGNGRYSSNELAESVKTNPVVIRRQLAGLREAGIVKSQNGPNGGFYLKEDADKITLWDLYTATREGDFFHRPRLNPDCVVSSNLKFLVEDAFYDAELSMRPGFENTTVQDLADKLQAVLDC